MQLSKENYALLKFMLIVAIFICCLFTVLNVTIKSHENKAEEWPEKMELEFTDTSGKLDELTISAIEYGYLCAGTGRSWDECKQRFIAVLNDSDAEPQEVEEADVAKVGLVTGYESVDIIFDNTVLWEPSDITIYTAVGNITIRGETGEIEYSDTLPESAKEFWQAVQDLKNGDDSKWEY